MQMVLYSVPHFFLLPFYEHKHVSLPVHFP